MAGQVQGTIKTLDTYKMDEVAKNFQKNVTSFGETKLQVSEIVNRLLLDWTGDAKVEFQTQFELIYGKLEDIEEALKEFYENLLEAEISYREVDDELGKVFQQDAENLSGSAAK